MATLSGSTIASTYDRLLALPSGGLQGSTLRAMTDGNASATACISITDNATSKAILSIDGSHANGTALYIDNSAGVGDVSVEWQLSGTTTWLMGIDDDDNDSLKICHDSTMGTDERLSFLTASTVFNEDSGDIDFRVEGNGDGSLLFCDASTDRVGIGTSSPSSLLDLQYSDALESTTLSAAMTAGLTLNGGSGVAVNEFFPAISWYSNDGDINSTEYRVGAITCKAAETFDAANDAGADMQFFVHKIGTDSDGPALAMTIQDDANVGIGTAAPLAVASVTGGSAANNIGIMQITTGTGVSADNKLVIGIVDDDRVFIQALKPAVANINLTLNAAGGNVGIGTTSPDTTLEVAGSFAANGPSSTFVTFADGDATPSVATGNIFKHHASTQTIDMFDGGICGQIITVISTAAITYDFNASNLKCGTTDIVTASGDVTVWVFDGTNWYLLSWMDVSIDLSSGGF